METQSHMEMAQREIHEERTKETPEEITEERFLKDLFLFMKKRDSPIDRIPNLGFKQIDLFLMFKIVRDMGGYHQVTAQQLWKQVYNSLGGNPRSTSAATCTRRHYEKLLLPYECQVTGILVNVVPRNETKHYPYANYSKEHDGQRPAKRKLLSIPQHHNPEHLQPDPHQSVFPLPSRYTQYYHPSHAVLPPYVPISSSVLTPHGPLAPKPWFSFPPSPLNSTDRYKEPLEQLRYLAEQFKSTSRSTEPLNLSPETRGQETYSNPASSFSPPSSSKNPKFLNKPSPLYTSHRMQVVRNDGYETQDGEAALGDAPYSYPVKAREAYVVDHTAVTASSSPTYDSAPTRRTDEGATAMAQKPSSPKTELMIWPKEEKERSPEVRELDLSDIMPSLPQEDGGKMEIKVPLSVFRNWLKLCGSSARMNGAKQQPSLPPQEDLSEQRNCSNTDILPTNLTMHMNRRHQSSAGAAEDIRLMQRSFRSPTTTTQTTGNHHNTSQNHFTTYKPLPFGGVLKSAASQDTYRFDQQDINKSYSSKPTNCWDAYDKETQASPIPVNIDYIPHTVQQDHAASISHNEDTVQGGKEKSDMGPLAVLMFNSSSSPLLHLTTEEVMKLKQIISTL